MILEVENTLFEALRNLFKENVFETESGSKTPVVARMYSSFENIDTDNVVYPCILVKLDEDTNITTKEKEDKSLKYHFFIATNTSNKEKAYEETVKMYEIIKNTVIKNGRIGNVIADRRNVRGVLSENGKTPFIWMDMSVQITDAILSTKLEEENFYDWEFTGNWIKNSRSR